MEFKVSGMNCNHCVDKIEKFIGEIDGILSIHVDLSKKMVSVEAEDQVRIADVKEAILESGFEVE